MRIVELCQPEAASGLGTAAPDRSSVPRLVNVGSHVPPALRTTRRQLLMSAMAAEPGLDIAVRVSPYADDEDIALLQHASVKTVILGSVRTSKEVRCWIGRARAEGVNPRLVLEVRSGAAFYELEQLCTASGAVEGIWYAAADLLIDFQDRPPGLYFYDNSEPRFAAPRWLRSRTLTFARAFRLELWGQLDLTVSRAAEEELASCIEGASQSGFDVVVTRHARAAMSVLTRTGE